MDCRDASHSSQSDLVEGCHTIKGLSEEPLRFVYGGMGIWLPVPGKKSLHPDATETLTSAWPAGTL